MSRRLNVRASRRMPGAKPLVSPATIFGTSLKLWLRADKGVSGAAPITGWADQSAQGDSARNCTVATGAPTLGTSADLGGQASIAFVDNDRLVTGTWDAALAQPCTVVAVVAKTTTGSDYITDSLAAGTQMALYTTATPDIRATAGGSDVTHSGLPAGFVAVAVYNGASSKIYVNSKTASATANAGANGATGMTIGNYAGGGAFSLSGAVAEVIVISGAISVANLATLLDLYIGPRYGLTIT